MRDELDFGEELLALLANAPYALIIIDTRAKIVELNTAAEELFATERTATVGRSISWLAPVLLIETGGVSGETEEKAGGLEDIVGRSVERMARRADGDEVPVELTVIRPDRRSRRLALWVRDLSAQRTAAQEVRQRESMFAQAEELAHIGSWDWDSRTGELRWSDNTFRLLGLEPGAVTPTPEYLLSRTHSEDVDRLAHALENAIRTGRLGTVDYRVETGGGGVRHLRSTVAAARDAEPGRFIGFVQDITERRRAAREIAAHVAVAEALNEWRSFEVGAEGLLRRLGEAMEFECGLVWTPAGEVLVPRVAWHRDHAVDLLSELEDIRSTPGMGLAGRAWSERMPVTMTNARDLPGYMVHAEATGVGVRGGLALPAVHGEEVLAVISFGDAEEVTLSERLFQSLTGIGYELGLFLNSHRYDSEPSKLTAREIEVLELAAQGMTREAIAERLVIHPSTVKSHFENIYSKLGVPDRAAAVAQALRHGLID